MNTIYYIKESLQSDPIFVQKVLDFISYPWQEDLEIEFVNYISEYQNLIRTADTYTTKNYLRRLYKELEDANSFELLGDKFINDLNNLIK
jgi:hypothetical protein